MQHFPFDRCSNLCVLCSQVALTSLVLSDKGTAGTFKQIASADVEQLKVHVSSSSDAIAAEVSAQEITVQDLTEGSGDNSHAMLARWQQSGETHATIALQYTSSSAEFAAHSCI